MTLTSAERFRLAKAEANVRQQTSPAGSTTCSEQPSARASRRPGITSSGGSSSKEYATSRNDVREALQLRSLPRAWSPGVPVRERPSSAAS